jgi:hypothetical protein
MDLQITNTGTEPLSASEVKNYLKVDYTTDDTLISDMITAVRELAEEFLGRALIAKTIVLTIPKDYDLEIELPYPDHNAVSAVTINGDDVLADCYIAGNYEKVVKLPYVYNEINDDNDGLVITYTCLGNVPKGVKIAMLQNIAEMYERRGNTFEGSIATLTENTIAKLTRFQKL